MKKALYAIWSKILTSIGDVKIFKFPMFVVYDPNMYQVTGEKTLEIMEILQPGDVICRGFQNYLDGKFIPSKAGWSHGAIYVGEGKIIHAVAEGVSETDVVEFTRCDRIMVLRPRKYARQAVTTARRFAKQNTPYDFGFSNGVSSLYCFELCSACYPKLDIRKNRVSKLFGLLKKDVYLAESFTASPDFDMVFCYNPKFSVDFRKN